MTHYDHMFMRLAPALLFQLYRRIGKQSQTPKTMRYGIRILNSQLPNCPHQNAVHTDSSGFFVAFFQNHKICGRAGKTCQTLKMQCSRMRILNPQLQDCPHQNVLHTSSSDSVAAFLKKNPVAGRATIAKR